MWGFEVCSMLDWAFSLLGDKVLPRPRVRVKFDGADEKDEAAESGRVVGVSSSSKVNLGVNRRLMDVNISMMKGNGCE